MKFLPPAEVLKRAGHQHPEQILTDLARGGYIPSWAPYDARVVAAQEAVPRG